MFPTQRPESVLFVTLDSCRYDTFVAAHMPHIKAIGPIHRAMAPGNFTYSSHAAMFMGFTPGVASRAESFVNPKFGKILRMSQGGLASRGRDHWVLEGRNVVDGFKRRGYRAIGTGAVGWFNPATETGQNLMRDFDAFYFPGDTYSVGRQLDWLQERLQETLQPSFVFLNVGETHVPYYYAGAPWDRELNPCVPFASDNDADECRRRQQACLEYLDQALAPLLAAFAESTVIVCADHGDCWGEDGLWEHGIHHEKVLEVPLVFRLGAVNG